MGKSAYYDKQGLKKGPWSFEEDKLLINYINQHGHANWLSLPKNAGLQRRGSSCRNRWTNYLAGEMGGTTHYDKQGLKQGAWSPEEDQLLINYINQHGPANWTSLAKNAGLQRCGMSCRLRWTNHLAGRMGRTPHYDKQGLKRRPWSSEEDELLINYITQHGHDDWNSLPKNAGLQRCGNSCRSRWTNYLAREMERTPCCDEQGLKKGPWSSEEDELLINYVNEHGHGLQRDGNNCRLRWTNYLRPGIKRCPFTPEEENLVIQSHKILGNRWGAIAIQLPGRTDNDIRNYWNNNLRKRLITMGLDPQTHEPSSKPHGPKPPRPCSTEKQKQKAEAKPLRCSSTDPNPQEVMESARLEADARLSRESLIYNPYGSSSYYSDVFPSLWETEVGESFQNVALKENTEKIMCQSLVSETSSSTKCASSSVLTQRDEDVEVKEDSKSHTQLLNARSNSSGSNVVDDSSVFLDFPEDNDTRFLEIDIDDYLVYPSDSSND